MDLPAAAEEQRHVLGTSSPGTVDTHSHGMMDTHSPVSAGCDGGSSVLLSCQRTATAHEPLGGGTAL